MKLVIDGIIYQLQSNGGISRIFNEILPRICNVDDSLRITLLTQGQLRQGLPEHPHIRHYCIPRVERYLRPGRVGKPLLARIRRFLRQAWIGRGVGKIWHSTYYTQPERWKGIRIVTVADMIHERFPNLFNGSENEQFRQNKRRCIQEADAVICISQTTRDDVHRFYGIDFDSLYIVPLACSDVFRQLEQSDGELQLPTRQPFLLYVGMRTHYKNLDTLIQAYKVWSKRKDFALVLVGRPWSAAEVRRLAMLGVQDQVYLLTDVDDEALCHLYNQAVAFICPSLYEGFGIPLLEAMACGCPVIASRIPSTIEIAGECPIYFEPIVAEDLVKALDIALSEGRGSKRVQVGLERINAFSWNKTATQTLEVYRNVSLGDSHDSW